MARPHPKTANSAHDSRASLILEFGSASGSFRVRLVTSFGSLSTELMLGAAERAMLAGALLQAERRELQPWQHEGVATWPQFSCFCAPRNFSLWLIGRFLTTVRWRLRRVGAGVLLVFPVAGSVVAGLIVVGSLVTLG